MTSQKELPTGWKWVKLGEVCDVQGGYGFKSGTYRTEGIPIVRIGDIQNGVVQPSDNTVYVDGEGISNLEIYLLEEDDLLMALSGATTGKTGIVKESMLPAYLNQRVAQFFT